MEEIRSKIMENRQIPPERSDFVGRCNWYASQVVKKKIVACKWVRLACQRHMKDIRRFKAKRSEFEFVDWYAVDVCQFAERMPHTEGVWPTETITLEDPQVFILCVTFGWRVRSAWGVRRFSSVYIEMARKGAKSTLTGVVALYCLACENEPGAQVIIGATTNEQAQKVFKPAKGMADKLHDFREAFGVETWARSITCQKTGGFIQTINSKGKTQDGWNPHVGILDELHAHTSRDLYDVITSAFGSRRNPLKWVITTAGGNTVGVCYDQHLYIKKVLEGILEADHYFGIIFTIDEKDDPYDERVWIKANPMLGITPTLKSMQTEAADAKASPASEGEFETKRLNMWRNGATSWLNMRKWKACGNAAIEWDDFVGLDVYIGGDLADKDDITALAVSAIRPDGVLICKTKFWLPDEILKDPKHARGEGPAPYAMWAKQGFLNLTPGDWVDHNEVEESIREWLDSLGVRRVTFDQFAAAQAMASRLNEDYGSGDEPIAAILHKKASAVTDAAKDLEARVKSGPARFQHDDNPVMNWMASNVTVSRRRDETLLPIKESQDSPMKIDGIDALINANQPMLLTEPDNAITQAFVEL